ncbi:cytochrome P450 [Streptomyces sp. PBH53]|uniref:cytochrome P450 n=1 Tax=Streptomyces sp. PBH53 TaxID=1577075 RepID=UPI0006554425|nr:cytochrome P450 [Streptomyces sp. PBH53]AKN71782.1 cytochrome P450 [Streptomyces sp. PBH53]
MAPPNGRSTSGTDTSQIVADVLEEMYSDSGRANPYPLYAQLRELGPVVTAPDGTVLISGYAEQRAFLQDHRLTKHPGRRLAAAGWPDWRDRPSLQLMFESMLFLNPPEHTRLRRLVSAAFTPSRVERMRPVVEEITADLLDALPGGTVNFVEDFALPMPIAVVAALLGVPSSDWPMFQSLARDWTLVLDDISPATVDRADQAAIEMGETFTRLAKDRAKHPRDDMMSVIVAAQGDDKLTGRELVTMAALLLVAGFETSSGLLSKGLVALLRHPEQAARLRAEPDLAVSAAEELIRYDSPIQLVPNRTAEEDIEVAGVKLAARQPVIAVIGAGNRDPKVFSRPEELTLDRQEAPPLSFGGGVHYCLGAPLARIEAQVALPAVLRRFPDIELAGTPVPRAGHVISGLLKLPVSL